MHSALPAKAVVLSNTETKAIETAVLMAGREPMCDHRFREVDRPNEPFDQFSSERRGAWIREEVDALHYGWETQAQAARRFGQAVHDHPEDDLLVATHGMVLVAWILDIGWLKSSWTAERYWSTLTFPQLIMVDIAA